MRVKGQKIRYSTVPLPLERMIPPIGGSSAIVLEVSEPRKRRVGSHHAGEKQNGWTYPELAAVFGS